VRDTGGRVAATLWRFNGWAKYGKETWSRDTKVNRAIAKKAGAAVFEAAVDGKAVVLEGGSIDVNGAGTLLTTEECLLSPVQARNPHLGREGIEEVMGKYLGIDRVIWLKNGIAGDDTHGHVDDLARFVNEATVVIAAERDRREANYGALRENLAILKRTPGVTAVPLPMPKPLYFAGQRLPASYANFYIANRAVLVPTFNDPHDRIAMSTLGRLFPGRDVVGVHAVDLVLGLGTLHCLTQQQPAAGNVEG
jgi:agmatine deiminase